MSKLSETFAKPALSGVVAAVGASILYGESGSVLIGSIAVPVPLLLFGTTLAADFVGELAHNYILPQLPANEKWSTLEGAIISPIAAGAASVLLLGPILGVLDESQYMKLFALEAGSVMAGDYGFRNFVAPMIQ